MKFKEYNKKAGIYKWENKINHKCYIGQSIDLGSRLRHHVYNFKHNRCNAPIYRAFNKYGIENFDVEVLYIIDHPESNIKPLLDRLEIAYIEKYNSYGGTGYNQTRGGDSGILGYKFTEEQLRRVKKNAIVSGKECCIGVYIYNIKTNWTIYSPSISFAANIIGCKHSAVSRTAHGLQHSINGEWIVALTEQQLIEFINQYNISLSSHRRILHRKRPVPGLVRKFNTPSGKKAISLEQREKIRNSLYKYKIYVYKEGSIYKIYNNSRELNDDLFHNDSPHTAMSSVKRCIKSGRKYKGLYTFYLEDINTKLF